jgi:hypothetical protein
MQINKLKCLFLIPSVLYFSRFNFKRRNVLFLNKLTMFQAATYITCNCFYHFPKNFFRHVSLVFLTYVVRCEMVSLTCSPQPGGSEAVLPSLSLSSMGASTRSLRQPPKPKVLLLFKRNIGFEVLTAVVTKSTVFWHITPRRTLTFNGRFGGTYHLYLQGQ